MAERISLELFRGDKLNLLIQDSKKKQKDIVKALNISAGTLSRYKNGTRQPVYPILKRLSTYFNVNTEYFFNDQD